MLRAPPSSPPRPLPARPAHAARAPGALVPFAALALAACADPPTGTTPLAPGDPHVLVLIVDGVRTAEITSATVSDATGVTGEQWAANLWADLAPDATVVRSILNPVLASTAPGHAALVTGRPEPLFTVGFQYGVGPGMYRPQVPTIFEEARDQLGWAAADAVFLANTVVPQSVNQSIYPGLDGLGGTWEAVYEPTNPQAVEDDDTRIVDLVQASIRAGAPPLLVVNLHDADRTGHDGVDAGYADRVAEQDAQIARLWRWLEANEPDYLDGLLLVVTSDHGRHDHELDGGWTNHGDSCTGCRELPLFLAGEGVAKGVVDDGTYTLLDIAPTLAAHLGVELPWAQGLPLVPLVEGVGGGRTGHVDVATAGTHVAARAWRDDFTARSEVVVDGTVVSTPGVLAAEAPVLLEGESATYACFRELSTVEIDGYLPWVPRCLVDDGAGWQDIGFPDDAVGPFWRPTLFEQDGTLWAAWLHTPLTRGAYGSDGIRLARWTPSRGWYPEDGRGTYFTTTDVTMTPTASGFLLAGVVNLADPEEPYTRRAAVWGFDTDGVDDGTETQFQLEALLPEPRRVERPAIRAVGDDVSLAMLAIGENDRFVAHATSADGGATWTDPVALPGEGEPFVHLTPQWDGDYVVWGALLDDGTAGLCRVVPVGGSVACVSTGSPRLDSFTVQGGVATVSVDGGVGAWEIGEVRW